METILIIGAGNLGSRHLQALRKVERTLRIIVCDTSKEALEIAQKRYDETKG